MKLMIPKSTHFMAIINCPECQNKVSDQASSCPHCGYPLKRNDTKALVITFVASSSASNYLSRGVPAYVQSFISTVSIPLFMPKTKHYLFPKCESHLFLISMDFGLTLNSRNGKQVTFIFPTNSIFRYYILIMKRIKAKLSRSFS